MSTVEKLMTAEHPPIVAGNHPVKKCDPADGLTTAEALSAGTPSDTKESLINEETVLSVFSSSDDNSIQEL